MKRLALAAALLLTAFSVRGDQILPTAEGTTWEYDSTGTITGAAAPIRSTVTIRAGRQLLDGKELVKLETVSNNSVSKTELIQVDDNGIVCLARTGKGSKLVNLSPAETVVVAPLKVGATWDQEGEVAGIKLHQHWMVLGEDHVTVPASQFRAFHLQCEDSSLMSVKIDRWFVPGTGIVKEVIVVRGPGMVQRESLELRKMTGGLSKPELPPASTPPRRPELPGALPKSIPPTTPSAAPTEAVAKPNEVQPSVPAKKLTVEVSSDPAGGLKTEFKSSVANIYVRWHGHGLPEGAHVRVVWVAEDVGDLVDPNFIVDETETIASVPDASARFTLGRPPDGWAEGKYRVEFYVDDVLTETVGVTIGK